MEKSFLRKNSEVVKVTLSVGATTARSEDSIETIVGRADKLMYRSKLNGRNRVTTMLRLVEKMKDAFLTNACLNRIGVSRASLGQALRHADSWEPDPKLRVPSAAQRGQPPLLQAALFTEKLYEDV